MEFPKMEPYIVYVQTNSNGYITAVNSSAFLPDTVGWTAIDSGYGDKYHHAQNNYFPQPIMTDDRGCRYKMVDGVAVECSAEEIAAQEEALPEPPMSETERIAELEAALDMLLSGVTE
ncbi:MAG: hypothetical protein IKL27_06465 [Oscillospiraceae bacterium]|nr:hypothetical protein [Oscillospiraceae bacterium]